VIQLQGDHRTKVMDFLTDKGSDKMGKYALAKENIKVSHFFFGIRRFGWRLCSQSVLDPRILSPASPAFLNTTLCFGFGGILLCWKTCCGLILVCVLEFSGGGGGGGLQYTYLIKVTQTCLVSLLGRLNCLGFTVSDWRGS